MKTPTNWEDSQLAREGYRKQRADGQRQKDIAATVRHYLTMLHTALTDDFDMEPADIQAAVESYYRVQ